MRAGARQRLNVSSYRGADAYFICDVCGQRWRRSSMLVRWDNARVDWKCNDPRPPQMTPPDIYPEGMPFPDARPPQDNPDAVVDGSYLQSVTGGMVVSVGVRDTPLNGQTPPPGALSPQPILNSPPLALGPNNIQAPRTIRTGPVSGGGEE